MARFFFHVFNGNGETPDEEGLELATRGAARRLALDSIRSMVAEEARAGLIDLTGRIAIEDGSKNVLMTVFFAEAFELRTPEGRAS